MKFVKTATIILAASVLAFNADAKPAKRGVRTVTQPDGTEIRIQQFGDEYMHFTATADGTLLHQDNDGLYTYGVLTDDGALVSSGIVYNPTQDAKGVMTLNIKDIDVESLAKKRNTAARVAQTAGAVQTAATDKDGMKRAPQTNIGLVSSTYPRKGSPKGLIILVQYSDIRFTLDDPVAHFQDMINGDNYMQYGGTGSALQYFKDQSGGQFAPQFDIYGPVTLPFGRKYYGGNDFYGNDQRPHYMVTDAIAILDPEVDFKQYDTDGDGVIDNVYIFYAGMGEADGGTADTVWPHSWDVRYDSATAGKKADGVAIGHYACSNEMGLKTPDGIGTFVHEFSHVMGLPDLYYTGNGTLWCTPSQYSILDYGPYNNDGRTPPNYGAYELNAMGWYEPLMLDKAQTVTLDPINSGQFGLIETSKTTEFFLFENRQLVGWDKYIPNHGMLIWHIDFVKSIFEGNVVNNNRNHQYVDIVEANNNPDGTSLQAEMGWPFPGTSNNTSFTPTTKPALKDWSGNAINHSITDIREEEGLIVFNVDGGSSRLASPVASTDANDISGSHFVAMWNAVPGATDYIINVYAMNGGETVTYTNGFDNSTYGDGWESSLTNSPFYTTTGNYGVSSPSYKFSTNGQTLTTALMPADIAKVEFWVKGQTTNSSSALNVSGLVNGSWADLFNYKPTNGKVETYVYDNLPAGTRQLRFTHNKGTGNIALDDVVITTGGQVTQLPDYTNRSTAGAVKLRVDRLIAGCDNYYFTVQATDGSQRSSKSEPVYVTLNDNSNAVDDIVVDNDSPAVYYNMNGVQVKGDNLAPGLYIRRQGNTAVKVLVR